MKMCDQCHEKPATVHFTQVVNGEKTETYLCAECAAKEKKVLDGTALGKILLGLANKGAAVKGVTVPSACPKCGMEFTKFAREGMLGCEECYKAFAPVVMPMIRRMHGSLEHRGRGPEQPPAASTDMPAEQPDETLDRMKAELQEAIKLEEYERAAQIRDAIKAYEAGGNQQ